MRNFIIILLVVITIISCKKELKEGTVVLNLKHFVKEKPLELNVEKYISPTGHPYQVTKMVYYISELSFIATDGSEQVFHSGYRINVAEESTLNIPFKKLRGNKYNKIKFTFGFKKSQNYIDYLPQTIENQNMYWFTPQDSLAYHYMKFEGKYDSLNLGVQKQFKYHFGPTDGNDNSFDVIINVPEFAIDGNTINIVLKVDLQEWLQNPTEYNFPDYTMVMMKQDVQEIYNANGKSVFSFKEILKSE